MNKIALEILALSNSISKQQSYAVILGEVGGTRKLPIVIGGFEAQSIAIVFEHINPIRPLTHDLMVNVFETFGIVLKEVVIYKLLEGIFYANLICEKDGETFEIDARTSDSISLAIRVGCPIFTFDNVLNEAADLTGMLSLGIESESEIGSDEVKKESQKETASKGATPTLNHYSVDELKQMMQRALENEDYDLAIQIRDELKKRGIHD
ncbi:MAG TPA: bifunctional nuclease family protein [Edaphocola sp.]|nr:bifunctional nuclease family protein [Edaphocola sp.]